MILQYLYRPICNFIYNKITYRLSDKTKNLVIFCCFLLIFTVQFLAQYIFLYNGLNRGVRDYIICLAMGVIIVMSISGEVHLLKWKKNIYIPYVITGILLLIAVMDHELGPSYKAFPLIMLVGFMCFFFVLGNSGIWEKIFTLASKAYIIFIVIIFLICVVRFAYYDNLVYYGYAPFNINPNGVAKLYIPGIVCGLYLSFSKGKQKYIYAFIAGISIGVIYLTDSRAGMLSTCIMLAIFFLFLCLDCKIYSISDFKVNKDSVKRGILIILTLVISCYASIFLIKHVSYQIHYLMHNEYPSVVEGTTQKDGFFDSNNSGTVDTEVEERETRISKALDEERALINKNEKLETLNVFLRDRLTIWLVYIKNMTLRGNSKLIFYDTEYAHNEYIELSYKAGVCTGITYLILSIGVAYNLLINIIRFKCKKKILIFQTLVFIAYFVITMFDTGILPFERGFILLYFISLAPMIVESKKV